MTAFGGANVMDRAGEGSSKSEPWVIVWFDSLEDDQRVPAPFQRASGRASPFEARLDVAKTWARPDRILPVVLRPHKPWWSRLVGALIPENLAEQPFDRGTAPGVLLAILRIYQRDPKARVILLSDGCEGVSARRVAEALERVEAADEVVMVARPESGRRRTAIRRASMAFRRSQGDWRIMIDAGQARAGGVIVTTAQALRQMFLETQRELAEQFSSALAGENLFNGLALDQLYPFLPELDFQAEVLARASRSLTALVDEMPRTTDTPAAAVSV